MTTPGGVAKMMQPVPPETFFQRIRPQPLPTVRVHCVADQLIREQTIFRPEKWEFFPGHRLALCAVFLPIPTPGKVRGPRPARPVCRVALPWVPVRL